MSAERVSVHGEWSSRWTFILATTGAAVGLGNIWKFPYLAGEHGGSAFVLVYLVFVALLGIPMMMAEVMLGRRGRQTPMFTMRYLAEETNRTTHWQLLGLAGTVAGVLILSYYSVIGGWTLSYVFRSGNGDFHDVTPEQVSGVFASFVGDPLTVIGWHTAFMVMTMLIVARGVQGGLEQATKYLMPALVALLLVVVGYSATTGYMDEGLTFLFAADFSKLTGTSMLAAMGQAFFSLSLGMGTIMVYGSYLPAGTSIARTSILIALADTSIAVIAGIAIFPIVFANGLEPGAGPGLIFETLPLAFSQMPGGLVVGVLFFVLLLVAAWTSSISLIEPAVTLFMEKFRMTRHQASVWAGVGTWGLGLGTVFSFNLWADYKIFDKTFFDLLDHLTSNIMLPLGGLFMAVFAGWLMAREMSASELRLEGCRGFTVWHGLIRYVAPVAMLVVFAYAVGIIEH